MPTRDDAYALMTAHVKNEHLQKHMLSVEAAMCSYARKYGQAEELWALCMTATTRNTRPA
jgi:predicted hydrolase (HD superfamily)